MVWVISVAIFLGTILFVLTLALIWSLRVELRAALKEHRRESRMAVDIVMELSNADEPFIHETASTQNVSRHGARVLTKAHWRPNGMLSRTATLVTGKPLVQQHLNLNSAVLRPSGLGLVRRYWCRFTHGARRHNVPNRHIAVLDQIGNYVLCAVHAQILVHCRVAARIGKAPYLHDVPPQVDGIAG
jgi:hypothetical protein